MISSTIEKDNELKAQDKVLEICRILGSDEYYNAVGGQELYSYSDFSEKGIKLSFLKTSEITYQQFKNDFQSNLSIIDVMMFNSKDEVKKMLCDYTLINE